MAIPLLNQKNGDVFSVNKGLFGRIEVVQYRHNLVTHIHSQTNFSFWISGGAAYTNIGPERVNYQSNTALGINSLVSHDLCLNNPNKPATFLQLYVDNQWLDEYLSYLGGPVVLLQSSIPVDYHLQLNCWKLVQKLTASFCSNEESIDKDILNLVTQAVKSSIATSKEHPFPLRRKMVDHRLRLAMAHMRENLATPSIIDDVADIAGLSRSRFFELFHDQIGTSPNVFWNSLRAEEAIQRLISENENMTSVAIDLGFSSPGNFSRFFREHTGVTPSTFRRFSHAH